MSESHIRQRAHRLIQTIQRTGLSAPAHIRFGCGELARLDAEVRELGPVRRAFLVVGQRSAAASGLRDHIEQGLKRVGVHLVAEASVTAEPTVASIDESARAARAAAPDLVLAAGGGSAIDTGKAVAALLTNPGSVEDYLEGVGRGLQVERDPAPLIAVPTTSGTGAEMTKNAVVADYEKGFKKSMRDARMIPAAAILDPEVTFSVPRQVTAASGMDAITQLIEPCLSTKRRPETSEIAREALHGARGALAVCCRNPSDREARSIMSLASGISGIALANAGLGLVHGIASGLGGLHHVAHGLICGVLLPHALRYNRDACEPELAETLRHFLGDPEVSPDTVDRGIAAIEALKRDVGVPADLSFLGLDDAQVTVVAERSMGSSLSTNPIPMTPASTYGFLRPLT